MYVYTRARVRMCAVTAWPSPPVSAASPPYVGNPGFGIHVHPLDSVNPAFIRRAPLVNPLDSFGLTYRDS